MSTLKSFKISQLEPLLSNEISDNDLLLVSDTDNPKNGKKYESRSLQIGALQNNISANIAPQIKESIETDLGGAKAVKKLKNFASNYIADDPLGIDLIIDCGDSSR